MKKILHVLPMDKLSGAEKVALLICKNLKKYEPIVVCGGENLAKVFKENNIKAYSLNFSNKRIVSVISGLKKIVKENDVEIIHAHDNIASINSYLTKKIYGLNVKIISHIHSCYPWLIKNGFNKKIDSVFRERYDLNLACGNLVYEFYEKNTNYFNIGKAKILSNAIDIEEVTKVDLKKSEINREKFNIPKNKTIIGFVGRLDKEKGLVQFINKLIEYKKEFNDCVFLLVGSGALEGEIKSLIKKHELEESFILTGFQSDVYSFYPLIDIFFLPSLYEGLPMVILEAMAFNIPIISMDIGSIYEVIKNKENGLLIKSGELDEFLFNIVNLKKDFYLREKFSTNSYKILSENYNIKNYIKSVELIYKSIF